MLTGCVMNTVHDNARNTASRPDTVAFLGVSTFLKPSYRIAVTPRTGALAVQVEPVAVQLEPLKETVISRH